jgi:hypothetical protein
MILSPHVFKLFYSHFNAKKIRNVNIACFFMEIKCLVKALAKALAMALVVALVVHLFFVGVVQFKGSTYKHEGQHIGRFISLTSTWFMNRIMHWFDALVDALICFSLSFGLSFG